MRLARIARIFSHACDQPPEARSAVDHRHNQIGRKRVLFQVIGSTRLERYNVFTSLMLHRRDVSERVTSFVFLYGRETLLSHRVHPSRALYLRYLDGTGRVERGGEM